MTRSIRSRSTRGEEAGALDKVSSRPSCQTVPTYLFTPGSAASPDGAIHQLKVNLSLYGSTRNHHCILSLDTLIDLLERLERSLAPSSLSPMSLEECRKLLKGMALLSAAGREAFPVMLTSWLPGSDLSSSSKKKASGRKSSISKGGRGARTSRSGSSSSRSTSKA